MSNPNLFMEVLEMLGGTIAKVVPITIVLALVFSVLTHFWACNPGTPWWRKRELVTDLCYWFFVPLFARVLRIGLLVLGAGVVFNIHDADELIAFYDNGHGPLSQLPLRFQGVLFLVLSDFMLYWLHRLFHGRAENAPGHRRPRGQFVAHRRQYVERFAALDPVAGDGGAQGGRTESHGAQSLNRLIECGPGRRGEVADPQAWREALGEAGYIEHPLRRQGSQGRQAEFGCVGGVEVVLHQRQVHPARDGDNVGPPTLRCWDSSPVSSFGRKHAASPGCQLRSDGRHLKFYLR